MVQTRRIDANLVVASVRTIFLGRGFACFFPCKNEGLRWNRHNHTVPDNMSYTLSFYSILRAFRVRFLARRI